MRRRSRTWDPFDCAVRLRLPAPRRRASENGPPPDRDVRTLYLQMGVFSDSGPAAPKVQRVAVLDEDPALYEVVGAERAPRARGASAAAVLQLPTGSWNAADHAE